MRSSNPAYLIKTPAFLKARTASDLGRVGRKPWVRMNQAQQRALAPSRVPAWGKPSFVNIELPPSKSITKKFSPRGRVNVPTVAGSSEIILTFRVPAGFTYQVDGYAIGIAPSDLYIGNYIFSLFMNGNDILNNGSGGVFPGLPAMNGEFLPLGYTPAEKYRAEPGTLIELVAAAINPIVSGDELFGTVYGTLFGDIQ